MLSLLFQGLLLGFTAGASPGPFQAFLLSEASQKGARKSLPLALSPLLSDGPIILLTIAVLSRTPEWFLASLKIAGGLFILYLAYAAGRAVFDTEALELAQPETQVSLLQGAVMNALNPNPWIYWSTIGAPIVISGWRESPLVGSGFLLGFYLSITATNALLIFAFASLGGAGSGFRRNLLAVSVIALLGFGLFQLITGLRDLNLFS